MYNDSNLLRSNSYNRQSAVNYAIEYALRPNSQYRYFPLIHDSSGDCANFLSQCLKAGGAPMSYKYGNEWWYNNQGTLNNVKDDTWSISWTVAHSLYWYLKINGSKNTNGSVKGVEVNYTNQLELGDVIFYEDYKGVIFHSAIITSFSVSNGTKMPLISHHSYEAINVPYKKDYPYKKVHFLKIII